jgi:hypothetical protein
VGGAGSAAAGERRLSSERRQDCQYAGQLSDCTTHGTTCAYGNSPVVCNRCGTQIVHRQVQGHAHQSSLPRMSIIP